MRGVERGSREVITPALLRLTVWFHRLWPGAVSSLVVRTGAERAAHRAPAAEPRERKTP